MAPAVAANAMTKITLSFLLSLLGDKNFQGPDAPVNSKYHWAYKGRDGPESWHVHYKYCAGERQSPINVLTNSCEYDPTLEPIILEHFDTMSGPGGPCILNVTNNGHAASVRVLNQDMRVRGGGLGQVYKTVEFHFHWGSTDDVGSEHAVNGKKYPLEMHIVNYAEKYGNVKAAMTQPDGLAVLGVFFEIAEKDNPQFTMVDDALRRIHKAGEHTTINQLRLRSLLPDNLSKFWRYNGSLTTPFCFESVIWTLFSEPQKISKSQLEVLRSLLHEEGHDVSEQGEPHSYTPSRLLDNWRPIQPMNGRVAKQSFRGDFMSSKPFLDTKMTPFEAPVPAAANSARQESVAGTIVYNINPTFQPTAGQESAKEKIGPQNRNGIQPQITEISSFNSQQSFGRGPKEEKLLIYNQGSAGALGANPSSIAVSSEKPQQGELNSGIALADAAPTTLFGQIQQSNPGLAANSGPEASINLQVKAGDLVSYSSVSRAPDLHKDERRTTQKSQTSSAVAYDVSIPRQVSSSGGNDFSRHVEVQQSSTSAKVVRVINTSTPTPPSRLHVSPPPKPRQSPRVQPSVQALAISQPMRAQSLAVVRNSQPPVSKLQTQPVQNTKQLQNTNRQQLQNTNQQQQHPSSAGLQSSRMPGQIDSRIAELANNIRMHRLQGMTHTNTQPANTNHHMPPVIRHNHPVAPPTQNQPNVLNLQRQQQHPPLQIPHANKPPNTEQLRAIFQRLAASSRANSRMRTITSGAAAIPRVKQQQVNSVSGASNVNPSSYSGHPTDVSNGNQHMTNRRDYNPQFLSPASSTSLQSTWTNPNTNGDYISSHLSPQTYWQQPYQQQPHTQQSGYQQGIPQQQNTHPQQGYPQQSQFQQQPTHQYYTGSQAALFAPVARADTSNLYYEVGPGVSGSGSSIMSVPRVTSMDANVQQVYLNSQQQPVRLLRPVYQQVTNWQPANYQNQQQYPFFVY